MIIRLVPGDMMVTVLVLLVTELVRFLLVFIFYRFVVFGLVWMSVCFIFYYLFCLLNALTFWKEQIVKFWNRLGEKRQSRAEPVCAHNFAPFCRLLVRRLS